MSEPKNVGGRPTKYTEDMPEKLIEFFNKPLRSMKKVQQATARGVVEIEIEEFVDPPFIESFCAEILICKDTFYRWVKKYPAFSDAFRQAKQIQAKVLLIGSMKGYYNSSISKLILANCTDYKEDKEQGQRSEIKVIIDKQDENL
jgi:uncharacterized Fe-S cluster-containing radical SAM superfamily enzyme